MESVVRATAELRPLVDVLPEKFDSRSAQVIKKLKSLFDALNTLKGPERMLSAEVANYVNAPIYSILQQNKLGDQQTEYVLKIIRFLVQYPWSTSMSLSMAQQYLSVAVYITAPLEKGQEPGESLSKTSAEVRTAGFECLTVILTVASGLGFIRDLEGPRTLGLLVFGLNGIKVGSEPSDQIAALKFVSKVLTNLVSDIQPVLPNSSSVLNNFIIGAYGYKHTEPRVLALMTLSELFVLGLGTAGEWSKNASVQVDKMLTKMVTDLPKSNKKVRAAMVSLGAQLAKHCWEPLELCQATILDLLLLAKHPAHEFLAEPRYQEALDKKMLEYMDELPTTLSSHDSTAAVSQLAALENYVQFKPNQLFAEALVQRIQESLPPLTQTSKAIKTDVFDATKIRNLITSKSESQVLYLEDLQVATDINRETQLSLYYLLRSLGSTQPAQAILSSFLEQLDGESGLASLQTLWLATSLLEGCKNSELANDYLGYAYSVVNDSTSFYSTQKDTPSVIALNTFVIGELALNPENGFYQNLVDGLFPIIDLLGSGQSMVVVQAKSALEKIAAGCGYTGVKDLILENKDYVLDGISGKINTMDITPATLNMLSVLVLIGGKEIVVYLDDIVQSLFIVLDRYHGYSLLVAGIFGVFSAIIEVMTKGMPLCVEEPPNQDVIKIMSLEELKVELARKPKVDERILEAPEPVPTEPDEDAAVSDDGSDKDDFEPPMSENPEAKWDSPVEKPVYMIAKRIFDKCTLFLTHESPVLQASILRVVAQCVSVLGTNKNEFLPEVNSIWPVISARVCDEEVYVCESALHAVAVICSSAAEFMSSRIEKLWKEICEKKPASFYARKYPDFSPEKRWITALAGSLAQTLVHTRVDFETFDSIVWTLKPVLKEYKGLLNSLERINPDDVWLSQLPPGEAEAL